MKLAKSIITSVLFVLSILLLIFIEHPFDFKYLWVLLIVILFLTTILMFIKSWIIDIILAISLYLILMNQIAFLQDFFLYINDIKLDINFSLTSNITLLQVISAILSIAYVYSILRFKVMQQITLAILLSIITMPTFMNLFQFIGDYFKFLQELELRVTLLISFIFLTIGYLIMFSKLDYRSKKTIKKIDEANKQAAINTVTIQEEELVNNNTLVLPKNQFLGYIVGFDSNKKNKNKSFEKQKVKFQIHNLENNKVETFKLKHNSFNLQIKNYEKGKVYCFTKKGKKIKQYWVLYESKVDYLNDNQVKHINKEIKVSIFKALIIPILIGTLILLIALKITK